MLRHMVSLLALTLILGSVLSGNIVDDKDAEKATGKAAREEPRKEREEKRLAKRKEIQNLKEQVQDLTKQLNEKSRLLDKCNRNGGEAPTSGADQNELNKLKDQLATSQAEAQKLRGDLAQCGESEAPQTDSELTAKCQAPVTNVAFGKTATQSAERDSIATATKAVDGNRSPFLTTAHSCAVSKPSPQGAWWQVDLGKPYYVQSVLVTNRDNYADRLRDFEIRLYTEDPTTNSEATGTLCAKHEGSMLSKETSRFFCQNGPIKARYVRIINAPNQYLQLCEVKVMALGINAENETCPADAIPQNVAQGKPATMSSQYHEKHPASNALDNNLSPYASLVFSSCAHTKEDPEGPWWQVDLGQNYNIHYVVIVNRFENGERLKDFSIKVYKDDPSINPNAASQLCKFHPGSAADGKIITLVCDDGPLEGRYVRIKNAPGFHLQLCEVEVFATKA